MVICTPSFEAFYSKRDGKDSALVRGKGRARRREVVARGHDPGGREQAAQGARVDDPPAGSRRVGRRGARRVVSQQAEGAQPASKMIGRESRMNHGDAEPIVVDVMNRNGL